MAHLYNYAIIRFCPDERRGEFVNIGIVIFLDGKIDVRLTNSFAKAQALYPNLSFEGLNTFPDRINKLLSSFSSITDQHSLLRDYGPITVSELGSFEVHSIDQYEDQIQYLFDEFIIPPRAKAKSRSKTSQLKRNQDNGRIMDVKTSNKTPFKGVRKER